MVYGSPKKPDGWSIGANVNPPPTYSKPELEPQSSTDTTLLERGKRYGAFTGHAFITQGLKKAMVSPVTSKWESLTDSQKEALEMIAHKIGRILNGDPNYADSWHDIAGYASLIEKELNGQGV